MLSVLKLIVDFLINPIHILLMLIILSSYFIIRKKYKHLRISFVIFVLFFFISASHPIPGLLIQSLEGRYQPVIDHLALDTRQEYHILVLGGGHIRDPDLPATDQLASPSLSRLIEGIRLYHQLPNSFLVLSGYQGRSKISHAKILQDAASTLAVDLAKTIILPEPGTTYEEAVAYNKSFSTNENLILVTSAAHMPRAMKIFKQVGLKPIPAPTNYLIKIDPALPKKFNLLSYTNFYHLKIALHEYLGMLWLSLSQ